MTSVIIPVRTLLVVLPLLLMCSTRAHAANFGGPDAVENTIEEDARRVPSMV